MRIPDAVWRFCETHPSVLGAFGVALAFFVYPVIAFALRSMSFSDQLWLGELAALALVVGVVVATGTWTRIGLSAPRNLDVAAIASLFVPLIATAARALSGNSLGLIAPIPVVVVTGALTALSEELFYRGVLLAAYSRRSNSSAVLWSATFFALAHLANLRLRVDPSSVYLQVGFAFGLGVLWGAIRLRTGSLWPVIAGHFLVNTVGSIVGAPALAPASYANVMIGVSICLIGLGIVLVPRRSDLTGPPAGHVSRTEGPDQP